MPTITTDLINALHSIFPEQKLDNIAFEKPKAATHGDLSLGLAMQLASTLKKNPRMIAENIKSKLETMPGVDKIEIAGPGFINIFLKLEVLTQFMLQVAHTSSHLLPKKENNLPHIYMEFVSANPTGPLHVGHGRSAIIGKAIERLLKKTNYPVTSAYYVNDAGTQIDTLACSVILRIAQHEHAFELHQSCYQGDYIKDIAKTFLEKHQLPAAHSQSIAQLAPKWAAQDEQNAQKSLIHDIQATLDQETYAQIKQLAMRMILDDIKSDLIKLNVSYDSWYHESRLLQDGHVAQCLETLKQNGYIYTKDDATWFQSSKWNDEKDRVVIRSNGEHTYFLNDIAYHEYKYKNYDTALNIMGSDHHGYGPRLHAAKEALGFHDKKLIMKYVQFAVLWRGSEKVSMSTRSGEFVTLRELYEEVGVGPTLFFYALKKSDQHLDFDLELAKKKSNDNPYYYIQYAHARICQILKKKHAQPSQIVTQLTDATERALLNQIFHFPTCLDRASRDMEPHQICYYLIDLAKLFHQYYNQIPIINEDNPAIENERLLLLSAIKNTMYEALSILGISPMEKM